MKIILARHGKPAWDFVTPVAGRAFAEWLRGEHDAPIDASSAPPAALQQLVRAAGRVMASPLRRSLESVRLLDPATAPLVDPCFREAELPSAFKTNPRLRPVVWEWLARVAWLCGWNPGVEDVTSARARAARAAEILAANATERAPVVLIGHGFMNVLIAAQLRRAGWRGPVVPSRRHWEFGVYAREGRNA